MANSKHGQIAQWTRRPSPEDMPLRWEVTRVKTKELRGVIVLSGDIIGAYTHFCGGRTQPCGGRQCQACDENVQRRWYGYLAVTDVNAVRRAILELTPNAIPPIDTYFRSHRSLRGAALTLWRSPARPNGRLFCRIEKSSCLVEGLPDAPDLRALLEKMWRVNVLAVHDASDTSGQALPVRAIEYA